VLRRNFFTQHVNKGQEAAVLHVTAPLRHPWQFYLRERADAEADGL
jgi:hypothetical protein